MQEKNYLFQVNWFVMRKNNNFNTLILIYMRILLFLYFNFNGLKKIIKVFLWSYFYLFGLAIFFFNFSKVKVRLYKTNFILYYSILYLMIISYHLVLNIYRYIYIYLNIS